MTEDINNPTVSVPCKVQVTFYGEGGACYTKDYDLGRADDIIDWELNADKSKYTPQFTVTEYVHVSPRMARHMEKSRKGMDKYIQICTRMGRKIYSKTFKKLLLERSCPKVEVSNYGN